MAQRKNLLTIDYHWDDETGMYSIGEIDFGVSGNLPNYLKEYKQQDVKDILAALGHLAWEVKDEFYRLQREDCGTMTGADSSNLTTDSLTIQKGS